MFWAGTKMANLTGLGFSDIAAHCVSHSHTIGFIASGLVLATFSMKDIVNLRIVAICSNFAFIAYGLTLDLPPVWLLHVILLPLNCWRLAQAWPSSRPAIRLSGVELAKLFLN
jgi:CRP/FNR family transcriptional regulator, cyclic AMP receptor protein